jgi:hypothetical protein
VHLALDRYDREFEPRGEIILEFLAFTRIAACSLHFLRAALDVEAAELSDTGIALGSLGLAFGIDPEMLGIL